MEERQRSVILVYSLLAVVRCTYVWAHSVCQNLSALLHVFETS